LLLASSCERPLYFAAAETGMVSRLKKAGDVQLQGAVAHLDYQQSFQGTAAVAVSNHFALRAGWQQGADEYEQTYQQYGLLKSYHTGMGGFYAIGQTGWLASTWIGYSRGDVLNVSEMYDNRGRSAGFIRLTNDYSRLYLEQQLRYTHAGIEFFAILRGGNSYVFNLRQVGNPLPDSWIFKQIERQENNPAVGFVSFGYGCSGGSEQLRLHLQFEHWVGPGRLQLAPGNTFIISTGLSWRFGTAPFLNKSGRAKAH
jgi:hypothetical protein